MKNLKNLGIALNKAEQKLVNGGNPPCFEWCACPDIQEIYPNLYCNCNSGSGGNSGGGSNNDDNDGNSYAI